MKKLILLLALINCTFLMAQEKIDLNQKIPVNLDVRIGTLDNGLKYYIQHNDKPKDKVELRLVVHAGSMQEDKDQRGLAHFMEHMNFNGTKHFKKNELIDYLQSIGVKFGAHLNAYTSFNETVYMLSVPTTSQGKVDTGLIVLEDWAHNALLTEEEIDKERGVVFEEFRLGLGPDKRMRQEYLPLLLYKSRYAERLPIGKKDVIMNSDYDAVRRFYKDWYRPDLQALVVVGDIDVDRIEMKIKELFSWMKNPENPRVRKTYPIPNHEQTFISVQTDPEASRVNVRIVYKDPEPAQDVVTVGDYKRELENRLFTSMINSRLRELANSDNPPFAYGYSYYGSFFSPEKNAYRTFALPSGNNIAQALRVLLQENKRVKVHGFTEAEFQRAKENILARLEKMYKGRKDRKDRRIVGDYINNFLENEPIPTIAWELNTTKALFKNIKLSAVNSLIDEYIHDNNRVIIITGPESADYTYPTKEEIKNILKDVKNSPIEAYSEEDIPESLLSEIPTPGTIINKSYNEALDIHTITLSNGVKVQYKKTDFKEDEVQFSAFSFGGTNLLSLDDYRRIDYGLNGITEAGYNGMSKTVMDKVLTGKIASANAHIGSYYEGLSGSSTPTDLETLFKLIYLDFTALNKDKEAYTAFAEKNGSLYDNLLNNPTYFFYDSLGKFSSQFNPRYTGFPSSQDFKSLDYDFAYDFYNKQFADADDFVFFFVGNFDEDQLLAYAKTYLATLPTREGSDKLVSHPYKYVDPGQKFIVEKGAAPQSQVMILFSGKTEYNAQDDFLLDALGDVLTIKLTESLREAHGGVYGVNARGGMSKIPVSDYNFVIIFPCGPEHVDSLVYYALQELNKVKENGPEAADVEKVKKTKLLELKESKKGNKFWLDAMEKAYSRDMDIAELVHPEKAINALNADVLQKIANKYLKEYRILAILNPEQSDAEK